MERPILFGGEMVKAILAGRKTQTRRLVTQPVSTAHAGMTHSPMINRGGDWYLPEEWSPYGQPGDLLWVKERCAIGFNDDGDLVCDYMADGKRRIFDVTPENERYSWRYINDDQRPSIFMPRWASRLRLLVGGVRVEQLQEISEEDAKAEGVGAWHGTVAGTVYRPEFQLLWDKINGKRAAWASNPWVWVVEFGLKEREGDYV